MLPAPLPPQRTIQKSPFAPSYVVSTTDAVPEPSIDERAQLVFRSLDRSGSGYISFPDLAAVWMEKIEHENVPTSYDPHADMYLKEMFHVLDSKRTGKIGYDEFYRSFTFFEYFRAGYKKGLEMGLLHAQHNGFKKNVDLEFHEFWRILFHDKQLQMKYYYFTSSWNNVLHPGYLKTPIHKKIRLSAFEDFLAGSLAGIVTTLVGHRMLLIWLTVQFSF